VTRGHRLIFGCPHSTGSSTVAAYCAHPSPLTSQITIYGWSTRHTDTTYNDRCMPLNSYPEGGYSPCLTCAISRASFSAVPFTSYFAAF
jgi:hypothetical protein